MYYANTVKVFEIYILINLYVFIYLSKYMYLNRCIGLSMMSMNIRKIYYIRSINYLISYSHAYCNQNAPSSCLIYNAQNVHDV